MLLAIIASFTLTLAAPGPGESGMHPRAAMSYCTCAMVRLGGESREARARRINEQFLRDTAAIFLGTAVVAEDVTKHRELGTAYTFVVHRAWARIARDTVRVFGRHDLCPSPVFRVGHTYLVRAKAQQDSLRLYVCDRELEDTTLEARYLVHALGRERYRGRSRAAAVTGDVKAMRRRTDHRWRTAPIRPRF